MGGLNTWTAVAVIVLVGLAVVALAVRDEAAITRRHPQRYRSWLIAAAWPLTIAALVSCVARMALLY